MLLSILELILFYFYFHLRKNLYFSIFIISLMFVSLEGVISKIHCFLSYFNFVQLGSPSVSVFNKNGLDIQFSFDTSKLQATNSILITMAATNSLMSPMTNFVFQAAVPKVSFFFYFLIYSYQTGIALKIAILAIKCITQFLNSTTVSRNCFLKKC